MPKDMQADVRVEAIAGKPVELPSGHFLANADMSRAGMDLHITGSDGHTIVVEGYFAQQVSPDLVTHDGARLTPAMVSAFVPPEHAGQYAASGQTATDVSPAGKITKVVGDAHIIHADGTKTVAHEGSLIYQGDVVETSKTGAVNMQFSDNTTFAISDNARMSVDQFVYHASNHTGSTFFSMLQGVFVYTSGLIGKSDPGAVNIETPVGSIGIRGTVVAAHILPAGQHSEITIVDGAITLTNGTGTQELNDHLQTVSVNGYQSQPQSVQMDANTFNSAYSSMSSVAGSELSHFTGMGTSAPAGEHNAAPTTTAPTPAPAAESVPSAPAAGSSFGSGTGSSFASSSESSTTTAIATAAATTMSSGNTASSIVTTTTPTPVIIVTTPPPPPPGPLTVSVSNDLPNNSSIAGENTTVHYTLTFSEPLTGAPSLSLLGPASQDASVSSSWNGDTVTLTVVTGTDVGSLNVAINNATGIDTASLTTTVLLDTITNAATVYGTPTTDTYTPTTTSFAYDGLGGQNILQAGTTAIDFTNSQVVVRDVSEVDFTASHGNITLNAQTVYNMTNTVSGAGTTSDELTVKSAGGTSYDVVHIDSSLTLAQGSVWGVSPTLTYTGNVNGTTVTLNVNEFSAGHMSLSDPSSVIVLDSQHNAAYQFDSSNIGYLNGTTNADFLVANTSTSLLNGGGGTDILIGNTGGAMNIDIGDASFAYVDGGDVANFAGGANNGNILVLNSSSINPFSLNLSDPLTGAENTNIGTIKDIGIVNLGATSTGFANSITLSIQDVFNMTEADTTGHHTLTVEEVSGSTATIGDGTVTVVTSSGFTMTADSTSGGTAAGTMTFTGSYGGGTNNVTLVITESVAALQANHIHIATHSAAL